MCNSIPNPKTTTTASPAAIGEKRSNRWSETRLADEGSIAEPKRGNAFLWKEKAPDEGKTQTTARSPHRHQRASNKASLPPEPLPPCHCRERIRSHSDVTSSNDAKETYEEFNSLVKSTPPETNSCCWTTPFAADETSGTSGSPEPHGEVNAGLTIALSGSILTLHIVPNQQKRPKQTRAAFNTEKLKIFAVPRKTVQCQQRPGSDLLEIHDRQPGPSTHARRSQENHLPADHLRNGWDPLGNLQDNRISSTGDLPQHHPLHLRGRCHTSRVVSLYKSKGSKSDRGNYRGISLLSIALKILERINLNPLITSVSEKNLLEVLCGFRPNRSTTDMIFAVRQVQEKFREQNKDLYAVFIDLTKAFNTVNRKALWVILQDLAPPRNLYT
ncbi:hypothetical protein RRG08_021832 [Elysia crispata]|uniref:Reverse transcriptase domain-containing protein n=1 Tax=Elysia crispata TaxID=231223 RepID=A0AAE1DPB4_9GAST|nr:hypothetical protein RRG08_021832 [Elysia crispata]